MGLSCRVFIADDAGLAPVPQAKWFRIYGGQERLPAHANRELKMLEVVVEVDRRTVLRPIAVLPYRVTVDPRGLINRDAQHTRAMHALDDYMKPRTLESEIGKLQRDASYFWVPTDEHWRALGRTLKLPVDELKRALRQGGE